MVSDSAPEWEGSSSPLRLIADVTFISHKEINHTPLNPPQRTFKNGVLFHWFKYNTLWCRSGFHGNLGCETRIIREMSPLLPQRVRHHLSIACTHTFSVSHACCFHGNLLIYHYLCTTMHTQSARKEFQCVYFAPMPSEVSS